MSVATIHQALIQGTYCERSRDIVNYCQLLNYPWCRGVWSGATRCVAQSTASCLAPNPGFPVLGHMGPETKLEVSVVFYVSLRKYNMWWTWDCKKRFYWGVKRKQKYTFWIACVCVQQGWWWVVHGNRRHAKTFAFLWTDFLWSSSKQNNTWLPGSLI